MAEIYRYIINNLRKGNIEQRELDSLENGLVQCFDKISEQEKTIEGCCKEKNEYQRQIKEMQSHIDCLKAELVEVQRDKLKLPEEPIKVADMLISAIGTYTNLFGKEDTCSVYGKVELKQIADHLMVYCNSVEED